MSELDGESGRTVVLEVRDLSVSYGKVDALHGMALKVHRGEIVYLGERQAVALRANPGIVHRSPGW